jgi:hypothetical protein
MDAVRRLRQVIQYAAETVGTFRQLALELAELWRNRRLRGSQGEPE